MFFLQKWDDRRLEKNAIDYYITFQLTQNIISAHVEISILFNSSRNINIVAHAEISKIEAFQEDEWYV